MPKRFGERLEVVRGEAARTGQQEDGGRMRVLAHISDLHFGTVDDLVLRALVASLHAARPDMLVVSGDLTQRAREHEFQQARAFLEELPFPKFVIPGNHDLRPWWFPLQRWRTPLRRYRRYICDDLEPFFADSEIALVGVNSVRWDRVASGRLRSAQVMGACERLRSVPQELTSIVVSHHPFDLPEHYRGHDVVGGANRAMSLFARCGVEIFLSGHLHVSHIGESTLRYHIPGHSALVIQAGTAASRRGRGELNSWNLVRITHPDVRVERFSWDEASMSFAISGADHFRRSGEKWERVSNSEADRAYLLNNLRAFS